MPNSPHTFSLRMLLGVVTMLAISLACCALGFRTEYANNPVYRFFGDDFFITAGIGGALVFTPALVRASTKLRQRKAAGQPVTIASRAIAFLTAIGLMLMVTFSAGVAFVLVCLPLGVATLNSPDSVFPWVAGMVAGGAMYVLMLYLLWSGFSR